MYKSHLITAKPFLLAVMAILFLNVFVASQTTGFSYQGNLSDSSQAANGSYDFEFLLFDSLSGGTQLGGTLFKNGVSVSDGVFSVSLDFGGQFPGAGRWIEIRVRQAAAVSGTSDLGAGFTTLSPRQAISSSPYAVKSLNAENANTAITATTATNATQLGGISAGQFVITTDPRLSDVRTPVPGSADYIQNGTTQQDLSDFNISGTGAASKFDASAQYNLGGVRILSNAGTENLFVGAGTGTANMGERNTFVGDSAGLNNEGSFNSFFGASAGIANFNGQRNSFFGSESGSLNTNGSFNSYFGYIAGRSNVLGTNNSFFGSLAGTENRSNNNSFFGSAAGLSNTTGSGNSFFGRVSGSSNLTGNDNSFYGVATGENSTSSFNAFFGHSAGINNLTGASNAFFGRSAGAANRTGSNNTAIGVVAGFNSSNLTFATAIGSFAVATASNTIQLGRDGSDTVRIGTFGASGSTVLCQNGIKEIAGCSQTLISAGDPRLTDARPPTAGSGNYIQNTTTPQATSNFSISGTGRANILTADAQFDIGGNRILTNAGIFNIFAGQLAGSQNLTGSANSFFGYSAGKVNTTGFSNSFFGAEAGKTNKDADNNSFFGRSSGSATTTGGANSFFGRDSGLLNTDGFGNSFFGFDAGESNTTGSRLTVLGINADLGSVDLFNATAIGAEAQVDTNNSLVLGSVRGFNNASVSINVGIGTTSPTKSLHIGTNSGQILLGNAGCSIGVTAIGFGAAMENCENYSMAGSGNNTFINTPSGGTIYFRVNNVTQARINPTGTLRLNQLGSGGLTGLCRNASNEISTCSSSRRYKSNIEVFTPGLALIKKLRPVSFNWTEGGIPDIGLVAEEVAESEPLLTTTVDGRTEGVKYDRIGVVLVNAVKEQQEQISERKQEIEVLRDRLDEQKKEIARQQAEIDLLKQLVCSENTEADICKFYKQ